MISGIVNVIKPTGMSSHDVVGRLRRVYGMKKVGHAGTLDPLAAGVLPVYLGQATRLIEYGDSDVKTYHAEFALGLCTDTEDSTGEVTAVRDVPPLSFQDVEEAVLSFRGETQQQPPRYSAISVNGVKAYKRARQQEDFSLPARTITVYDISLLAFCRRRGVLAVTCSKGTYVRSLIRDIGEKLGTGACMTYLVRVRAGQFDIEQAASLEEIEAEPEKYVLPADAAVGHLPKARCRTEQCAMLRQGRAIPFAGKGLSDGAVVRVYGADGKLAGIARFDQAHHVIRPHKMFADAV